MQEVDEMFAALKEHMRGALGIPELEARMDMLEKRHAAEIKEIMDEVERRFDEVARKVAADFTSVLMRSRT